MDTNANSNTYRRGHAVDDGHHEGLGERFEVHIIQSCTQGDTFKELQHVIRMISIIFRLLFATVFLSYLMKDQGNEKGCKLIVTSIGKCDTNNDTVHDNTEL